MMGKRQVPADLRCEPAFPGLHTVCFSIAAPDWCMHRPSKRCPIEEPHQVNKCGEFV